MDNVIISDLNDATDKARSEVEYYKDMMIRSWLGKLKWDEEQGIFVREFQSKKKEAMKKDDLLKIHIPEHTRSAFRVCSQQSEVQK